MRVTLLQEQNVECVPIGYNFKILQAEAKSYGITELELYGQAINIYGFQQLFRNVHDEIILDCKASTDLCIAN